MATEQYAHTKAGSYADPGYQKDGKKRYALDTEEQVRAAYSYLSMPKNQAPYTDSQVRAMLARIMTAGRKYGIKYAADSK